MEGLKCIKCGARHFSSQPCKKAVEKNVALKKALDVLVPGSIIPDVKVTMAKKKRGRKKVHASNAEKQKAYRARKEKKVGGGS